jgi:Fic family protein
MDKKDFESSPSGQLVPTRIHLIPYQAFLPNHLPPQIKPSWEITNKMIQAQKSLGELKGLGRNIDNPNLFIRPFIRKEAVLSSRIEGTRTELIDLFAYEVDKQPIIGLGGNDPAEWDIREVFNYVKALEFGLLHADQIIDERYLCSLHKILLEDVRGRDTNPGCFRSVQNYIGKEQNPETATFIPPPVEELQGLLRNLVNYINNENDYPPLVKIALIHYQFETIHPFEDGNGRIGRLLNSILLIRMGLLDTPILYLSGFLEENREEYYQLLLNVSKYGNWEDWILFFMKAVVNQSDDAIVRITKLQDLKNAWLERLETQRATVNIIRLIDQLFSSPYITISEAEKVLEITNRAARTNIYKLVDAKIIQPATDQKYGQVFVAEEVLKIIRTRNIQDLN